VVNIQYLLTNSNPFIIPFHGVDTPSLGVKVGTIRCTTPFCDAASGIATDGAITVESSLTKHSIDIRSLTEATYYHGSREIVIRRKVATWTSMPSDLVVLVVVNTLQNINLSALNSMLVPPSLPLQYKSHVGPIRSTSLQVNC
jgi:hypothetical protein